MPLADTGDQLHRFVVEGQDVGGGIRTLIGWRQLDRGASGVVRARVVLVLDGSPQSAVLLHPSVAVELAAGIGSAAQP